MTTYAKEKYVRLPERVTKLIVKYMQSTNQGRILLLHDGRTLAISLYDGATNNEQTSGYHDDIRVEELPPAIIIAGLGDS